MITIKDDTSILSPQDITDINSKPWKFNVSILTHSAISNDDLDNLAHDLIVRPDIIVVAIDPVHHHTSVRFGSSTGVKPADFNIIAKAGNAHFKSGQWVDGINAVVVRAEASAQAKEAISVASGPVVVEEGLSTGAWFAIGLTFAALVTCIIWLFRKNKQLPANTMQETYSYSGRQPLPPSRAYSPPQQPAYSSPSSNIYPQQPVIVNQNSNDGLLTGIVLGEMMSTPRETIVEERVVEKDYSSYNSDYSSDSFSSSFDSGGSDSSWGGGGDFGGGSDSGGGDSGW